MFNSIQLAEMVNSANYASMSYKELVTINFALHLAILDVKPLIGIKKAEEMAAHTQEYMAKMKSYCATKEEILACIEKEMMEMPPHAPITPQGVDDQTSDVVPDNVMNEHLENREAPLLLPEHKEVDASRDALAEVTPKEDEIVQDDTTVSSPEEEAPPVSPEHQDDEMNLTDANSGNDSATPATNETESEAPMTPETTGQTLVEEAIEMIKTHPTTKNIDVNAPYYVDRSFDYGDNGEIRYSSGHARNMGMKDLERFRTATEKYMKLFLKEDVIKATEDCLVINEGMNSIRVLFFHFPKDNGEIAETSTLSRPLTDKEEKELKKKRALIKKAIKQANEESFRDDTDVNSPFYDRYTFHRDGKNVALSGEKDRVYEDIATLTEIKPALETYASLCNENAAVISKDNCVATIANNIIYLVLFNIPTQEKKKRVTKKSKPVTKDIPSAEESAPVSNVSTDQVVSNVIIKATEMSRALPVSKGTDVDTPYYVQQEYVISNDGGLFPDGKTFSTNISIDTLDKNKASHRKLARAMKASALVSGNDYTAFIWNEGKRIRVYSYHV